MTILFLKSFRLIDFLVFEGSGFEETIGDFKVFSHDEKRLDVLSEFLGEMGGILHEILWDVSDRVSGHLNWFEFDLVGVWGVGGSLENGHHAALTFEKGFDAGFATGDSGVDVDFGGKDGGGTHGGAKDSNAGWEMEVFLHAGLEGIGNAFELSVAECVDVIALDTDVDAFAEGHYRIAFLEIDAAKVLIELLLVELDLWEKDEVWAAFFWESIRGGSEPAGVSAHDLNKEDFAFLVGTDIKDKGFEGVHDIEGGAWETKSEVSTHKIIVDGLWNTHDLKVKAFLFGEVAKSHAGIHGVVATVDEKTVDVMFLEGFHDFAKDWIIEILWKLVAGRMEDLAWGLGKEVDVLLILSK